MIGNMFSEIDKLKSGLDASWLRSETISNNIANVDTPGYDRQTVAFEDYYRAALSGGSDLSLNTTRSGHFAMPISDEPAATLEIDRSTTMRMDGNNVDIEKEMTDMAVNTIYYYTLQAKVTSEFNQLNTAITGGA